MIDYYPSNHIPFRFGCRPREASRLEAKTHEAEAKPHEAEAEATTHEAEAEAEATFFGLEAEARPRGLTSLPDVIRQILECFVLGGEQRVYIFFGLEESQPAVGSFHVIAELGQVKVVQGQGQVHHRLHCKSGNSMVRDLEFGIF